MVDGLNIFINEDLSKPENRVNLALFSLMQQDWFRVWFLEQLGLDVNAVVYPPVNVRGRRPDLKVERDGKPVAWIEIELGKNEKQVRDYQSIFGETVKTVWGKREDKGDLSLEEVREFVVEKRDQGSLSLQDKLHCEYLAKLIEKGLNGHTAAQPRSGVSEIMRKEHLIVALGGALGDRLHYTTGPVGRDFIRADTVGQNGISLKVNRRDRSGYVAIFSISAGSRIIFPSRQKLERCLRGKDNAIGDYLRFIQGEMRCDVDVDRNNATPQPSLEEHRSQLMESVDKLSKLILALA